jgi:hypothetical protein
LDIGGVELSIEDLRARRGRLRSSITPLHLDNITQRDELFHRAIHVAGDLHVEGNLVLHDAEIQVLIVDGNLHVDGRLEDRDDEEIESLVIVGGNLEARDLITYGTLEVHGNLIVPGHLLLLDNACIAHIEGDIDAGFILDQYHHCAVDGEVRCPLVVMDSARIESDKPVEFLDFGSELAGHLDHALLEGEEDDSEPHGYYVDWVDVEAIAERVRAGQRIRRAASQG